MVDAGSIWIRLGLKADDFVFGIDKARYKLKEMRDETNASSREMAKWGAAITATVGPIVAAAGAAYIAIEKYGGMANQIRDLSYQTGVSTDQLQRMQYAAVLAGTDFSRISIGLNQLSLSIAAASDTNSATYKAFMGIGVDPRGRTVDRVFEDTTTALVGMRDETMRNEAAMQIYGKSWKELLPYMQTYIDKRKEIQGFNPLTKEELTANAEAKATIDSAWMRLETFIGKGIAQTGEGLDLIQTMGDAYIRLTHGDFAGFMAMAKIAVDQAQAAETAKLAKSAGQTPSSAASTSKLQEMYNGSFEGEEGFWMGGVFYPKNHQYATPAAKSTNWLDKIGAKYGGGEITDYALGISKNAQDTAASKLSAGVQGWGNRPVEGVRDRQAVDVRVKVEYNSEEAKKIVQVTTDQYMHNGRLTGGYRS